MQVSKRTRQFDDKRGYTCQFVNLNNDRFLCEDKELNKK